MRSTDVVQGGFGRKQRGEPDTEYQAFSFGRVGRHAQLVLLIRTADGQVEGFPYAHFDGINSEDEEKGFAVQFGRRMVVIEGTNLADLFRYVCSFRAAEIVEAAPRDAMTSEKEAPIVWKVKIR